MEDESKEVEKLEQELHKCREEADEYLKGWQRTKADFLNSKRETDAKYEEVRRRAAEECTKELVETMDELENALSENVPDLPWAEGIKLIYGKLKSKLERSDVREIEAHGKYFDPHLHEALEVIQVDEKEEDDKILEVVQKGYVMGESVLRPAKVKVGKLKD